MALTLVACPSCNDSSDCTPAPASCANPPPIMRPVDSVRACLDAPVTLTEVCSTSVNRCAGNAGLGPVCAFAPDGGVFFAVTSDNDILTANGWQFDEYPAPGVSSEVATGAQAAECLRAACLPSCPGAQSPGFTFCVLDGGLEGGDGG